MYVCILHRVARMTLRLAGDYDEVAANKERFIRCGHLKTSIPNQSKCNLRQLSTLA